MSNVPDYDLADELATGEPAQLRAMADPLRTTILDLLLERAASVTELAEAVGRPKSTVAHHVQVLVEAGLLQVVRTRRVRAIDERFYGRTARLFRIGPVTPDIRALVSDSPLAIGAAEAVPAHQADRLRAGLRHARIPAERADELWERVIELLHEFSASPRDGDTVYGFAAGIYPTDHPTLPEPVTEP